MKAKYFQALGFFVRRNFLPADLCWELRVEIETGTLAKARALSIGDPGREGARSTAWGEVRGEHYELVVSRLAALGDELELHYSIELVGMEEPQFLVYRQGDHFARHRDSGFGSEVPAYVKNRRVAVVVFLSPACSTPGSDGFSGGELTFYGQFTGGDVGIPLTAETGLLIAFPVMLEHEVTPIIDGNRYTIVTWFHRT